MSEKKQIWLPTSITKVTMSDGEEGKTITVWDEMEMSLQSIKLREVGFKDGEKK